MRNHMTRISILVLCIFLLLSLPGCWNSRELRDIAIVMGMGIDSAQDPDNLELTAQIVNPAGLKSPSNGGSSTGGKAYLNLKKSGDTIFQTLRDLTHESNRKLYFPHIQVIVFGRELAEKGIQEHIDFFLRDHETRLSIMILVADEAASQVFEVPPGIEKIPATHISKLIDAQKSNSETPVVNLEDFTKRLMSKTTAPIAPIVKILNNKEKKTLSVEGTAVFKDDQCIGELNKEETRGLLWVLNEIKSGIIDVPSPLGEGKVSLEILRAKSKITPVFKEDEVIIQIDIKEEGTLGSQPDSEMLTPEHIAALEQLKAEAIQKEVILVLNRARKLNSDIFGFGDKVFQKYPKEWENLEGKWEEIFPDLKVELTTEVTLRRTGRISNLPVPVKE